MGGGDVGRWLGGEGVGGRFGEGRKGKKIGNGWIEKIGRGGSGKYSVCG